MQAIPFDVADTHLVLTRDAEQDWAKTQPRSEARGADHAGEWPRGQMAL